MRDDLRTPLGHYSIDGKNSVSCFEPASLRRKGMVLRRDIVDQRAEFLCAQDTTVIAQIDAPAASQAYIFRLTKSELFQLVDAACIRCVPSVLLHRRAVRQDPIHRPD